VSRYSLCALDLDDTLLDSQQELTERNERAVRAILAKGIHVVLASGRIHSSAKRFADKLELDAPIISCNGAMVRTSRTNELWHHDTISGELAIEILDYCQEHNLQLNYYRDDKVYSKEYTAWLELYHKRTKVPLELLSDFYEKMRGLPTTKLVIVDSPERTDALLPLFRQRLGGVLYITKTTDEYLEFMPPQANKGAALRLVAERLGVPIEETVAFGDGNNDIPLLQTAGLGIAVGNAKQSLKDVAGRVIGHHDDDSVGATLEELFG
jgi:Cof subfamily protein (haloacid dehalogenase superfamily)